MYDNKNELKFSFILSFVVVLETPYNKHFFLKQAKIMKLFGDVVEKDNTIWLDKKTCAMFLGYK